MHSALVRAQNVFGFFTTVAFAVAALIAASDLIAPRIPSAVVTVDKVQVYVYSPTFRFLLRLKTQASN
jgi:signal peptidase complex subunit 3